jgi:hypothetical protein
VASIAMTAHVVARGKWLHLALRPGRCTEHSCQFIGSLCADSVHVVSSSSPWFTRRNLGSIVLFSVYAMRGLTSKRYYVMR